MQQEWAIMKYRERKRRACTTLRYRIILQMSVGFCTVYGSEEVLAGDIFTAV